MTDTEVDRLLTAIRSLCTDINSDLMLECGGFKFPCHTVLVRARCPALASLLDQLNRPNLLVIRTMPAPVLACVIYYIYTDRVMLQDEGQLPQLISATDSLGMASLQNRCLQLFRSQQHQNMANNLDILELAHSRQLESFLAVAVERVTESCADLVEDETFRRKMEDNPGLLLLLFSRLCEGGSRAPFWSSSCSGLGSISDMGSKY